MKNNSTNLLFNIYGFDGGNFGGNVYGVNGLSPTISTAQGGWRQPMIVTDMKTMDTMEKNNKTPKELQGKKFRIRKLTPRECFRLMGVDEEDIDTILRCQLSNSSLYFLAGNSIVVDVLYHIFRKMFIEIDEENEQLSLF